MTTKFSHLSAFKETLGYEQSRVGAQLYRTYRALSKTHFTANIEVSNDDDIYAQIMQFLPTQRDMAKCSFLTIKIVSKSV
jgi:hypothetical protein